MSLITQLEREYGIQVREMKPIKGAFQVKLHRGGRLCLKQMRTDRQDVKFVVRVFKHLRKSGYLYGPELLYTKSGKPWVKRHDVRYLLTNWVDGQSPDFNHRSQLRKAVKTLALFHIHAEGLQVSNVPAERMPIVQLKTHIKSAKAFIQSRVSSEEAKPFAEMCDVASDYLKRSRTQKAIEREVRAKAFVHGDYNYHNIVVDSSGHYQLIDFDKTGLQARMYDLAHLMYRVCPWNGDDASRLIEVYDRIRPLSREDLCLFVAFRCIPGSFIRSIWWGGSLDIPSAQQITEHMKWLRKTFD